MPTKQGKQQINNSKESPLLFLHQISTIKIDGTMTTENDEIENQLKNLKPPTPDKHIL